MKATGTDPILTAEEISVVCKEGKIRVCKESLPTASTIAKFATVQKESNVHFLHIPLFLNRHSRLYHNVTF